MPGNPENKSVKTMLVDSRGRASLLIFKKGTTADDLREALGLQDNTIVGINLDLDKPLNKACKLNPNVVTRVEILELNGVSPIIRLSQDIK